jgi:hypothetical protein
MKLQHEAGQRSWAKHGAEICPVCGSIVTSHSWLEKSRKGGIKSYLISLQPGRQSMSERGKHGGRPGALTIKEIERRQAAPGPLRRYPGLPPPT